MSYPANPYDDALPDVSDQEVWAESGAYTKHPLDACLYDGESWKAICGCMWEAWDRPSRTLALDAWLTHAIASVEVAE